LKLESRGFQYKVALYHSYLPIKFDDDIMITIGYAHQRFTDEPLSAYGIDGFGEFGEMMPLYNYHNSKACCTHSIFAHLYQA